MASNMNITEVNPAPEYCDCQRAKADFWCSNCNDNYCSTCCEEVHKRHAFSQHRMMKIHEKPLGTISLCQIHADEKIKYWCCGCKKLAYQDCAMLQHRDHKYVWTSDAANDLSLQLRDKLKKVQSSLNQSVKHATQMIGITEKINTETVTTVFASLHKMLDAQEKALKQAIFEIETTNRTQIESYQTELKPNELVFEQKNKSFESIVSVNDHIKLLQATEKFISYLQQIMQELDELKPPIKTEYQVKGIDQLQTAVGNMLRQNVIVLQTSGNVVQNNFCLRAHFVYDIPQSRISV